VETGWRFDDRIEVVKGLVPGERIVVSGNFLLDSESRMKTAAMGIFSPETDPICGMDVDRDKAASAGRTSTARGETYFFCSDLCKRQFDANPERHVRQVMTQSPPTSRAPAPAAVRVPGGRGESDPVAERLRQAERTMNMTAADAGGRTIFATDPVSGAEVDTTDPNAPRSVHQGTTYYFITPECKAEFDKDPTKFVEGAPPARAAERQAPEMAATAGKATAPAKDPVCGMTVDPKEALAAKRTSEYRGRTYYFCADECKRQFDAEPGKYIAK
jgi:YHS domain-containing protein